MSSKWKTDPNWLKERKEAAMRTQMKKVSKLPEPQASESLPVMLADFLLRENPGGEQPSNGAAFLPAEPPPPPSSLWPLLPVACATFHIV